MSSPRFLYSASGAALSGNITRPFVDSIPVQAGTMLPTIGGYSDVRVNDFRYKHMLSFTTAYTQVSGSQNPEDQSHSTLMSIVVQGLNVLDMLTADRIVARLTTKRKADEDETRVSPSGTCFENVRIGGYPLEIELNTVEFHACDTQQIFQTRLQNDLEFRKAVRAGVIGSGDQNSVPEKLQQRYKRYAEAETLPEADGITTCSLVKSMSCACPGVVCVGNAAVVPDFGVIYVAEYRVQRHRRGITMLRLVLGSPEAGDLEIGDGQGNGTVTP